MNTFGMIGFLLLDLSLGLCLWAWLRAKNDAESLKLQLERAANALHGVVQKIEGVETTDLIVREQLRKISDASASNAISADKAVLEHS